MKTTLRIVARGLLVIEATGEEIRVSEADQLRYWIESTLRLKVQSVDVKIEPETLK